MRDCCCTEEQENVKIVRCVLEGAFLSNDSQLISLALRHLLSSLTLPSLVGARGCALLAAVPPGSPLTAWATKEPIRGGHRSGSAGRPPRYGAWGGSGGVQVSHVFCFLEVCIIFFYLNCFLFKGMACPK